MRTRQIISFIALTAIAALVSPQSAISAPKIVPGTACKTVQQKSVYLTKTYTCVKSGKKLVWDSGVITPVVKVATPPTISADSDFLAAADCKLNKSPDLQMDDGPMGSMGFPLKTNLFPTTGNQKGLVILVDFSDVPMTDDVKTVWTKSSIPNAENEFLHASYGKLKLKIDLASKVYRLSKPSTYYSLLADPSGGPLAGAPDPKMDEVIIDGMKAADPDIDFSQYAFVAVGTPKSSTLQLSGATGLGRLPTQFDGKSFDQGDFIPMDAHTPISKQYKAYDFAHDIGHMLGLMHPYANTTPYHGAWDLMWPFAYQNDFLGWNKWKLGWVDDNQVNCLTSNLAKEVIQQLSPIGDATSSKKMLVIKLNDTQALVVEVRRKSPSDTIKPSEEGVIVYKVDTTLSSGHGAVSMISILSKTVTSQNFPVVLGTMKPGDSLSEGGFKISVLQSAVAGDYVSVKKE